jgi:hypothetical protein
VDETRLVMHRARATREKDIRSMSTVPKQRYDRYREAYLQMAEEAGYRPAAPSDGMGNADLTAEQLRDRSQLEREAHQYALRFSAEEDTHRFRIEVSNFSTNRAFIYTIEAARCLATGEEDVALSLLEMARNEVQAQVDD